MSQQYSAHIELDRKRLTQAQAAAMLMALEGYHPAVSNSPRGWASAQITLQAANITQATTLAVGAVVEAAIAAGFAAAPVAVEVMTETEFGIRQGHDQEEVDPVTVSGVISTADAAAILGVTPARVRQLVTEGKLGTFPVGRSHGFARAEVQQLARNRA